MYKLKIFSNFGLNFDLDVNEPCELYVDRIPHTENASQKFIWVIEPNEVSNMTNRIISNKDKFDFILAYDTNILEQCDNSVLFPYGTTWIKDYEFPEKKEYCITSLIGGKLMCFNHSLRHELVNRVKEIKNIPIQLFNSSNNPIPAEDGMKTMVNGVYKNELFYSQFHIVIENTTQDNWFTEKLMDCFQTKTVPIYIGCNNINEFFNINGILHVKDLNELVEVCSNINEDTYENMKSFIDENYKLSFKYSDHEKSLKEKITELLTK